MIFRSQSDFQGGDAWLVLEFVWGNLRCVKRNMVTFPEQKWRLFHHLQQWTLTAPRPPRIMEPQFSHQICSNLWLDQTNLTWDLQYRFQRWRWWLWCNCLTGFLFAEISSQRAKTWCRLITENLLPIALWSNFVIAFLSKAVFLVNDWSEVWPKISKTQHPVMAKRNKKHPFRHRPTAWSFFKLPLWKWCF